MFFDSEVVEENVMLGTDSHQLADGLHVVGNVVAEDGGLARRVVEEASEDADGGSLACSIVAQQHKYLVEVHVQRQVVHCLLPIPVHLRQLLNVHLLSVQQLCCHFFYVLLQFLIFYFCVVLLLYFLVLLPDPPDEEERVFLLAELIGEDLVEVEGQEHPEEHIENHEVIGSFD